MATHLWAKIAGWLQFAVVTLGQVQASGTPHGWAGWLTEIASLAAAVGIHAASNTGGPNSGPMAHN
jgi:hypothetical protein